MDAAAAVELIDLAEPDVVVPVHVEGWSHFSEQEVALHAVLDTADADLRARLRWLTRGEPLDV